MSDTWTEATTGCDGTVTNVDLYYHVETPAERAMRLSNALADLLARTWEGETVGVPSELSTEIIDALAEYSHLLEYVGASRLPASGERGT